MADRAYLTFACMSGPPFNIHVLLRWGMPACPCMQNPRLWLAERRIVLCGKYSSTSCKVRCAMPRGRKASCGRGGILFCKGGPVCRLSGFGEVWRECRAGARRGWKKKPCMPVVAGHARLVFCWPAFNGCFPLRRKALGGGSIPFRGCVSTRPRPVRRRHLRLVLWCGGFGWN